MLYELGNCKENTFVCMYNGMAIMITVAVKYKNKTILLHKIGHVQANNNDLPT